MSPDGWIWWYYKTRDSFAAPALNYVDSTGRIYRKRCRQCKGRKRHGTKGGDWVCGHCGADWPYVDRHIFKGEVQKSRRIYDFGHRHARYFDVARVLREFIDDQEWKWAARLYVANVMGYSLRRLAEGFRQTYPDAPHFEKTKITEKISEARKEWQRRLQSIGVTADSE